jgi:hypothetical protein
MHRQHPRAGRDVHRLRRRRGGHGSHRLRVGHQLRRQHHRRRHRGSYRHHRRQGVRHRPERRDDRRGRRGRRVGDHRDAVGDQLRPPGAVACCLVRRHRDAGHRDEGAHPGVALAGVAWPAVPRAALRRMGCFRPAACGPPVSEQPVADLASARGQSGSAPELLRQRRAAVRQPAPAVAPAARVQLEQRVWGRRAWPPGPQTWLRALQSPRRCRRLSPERACCRRMTHAAAARRVLPPSTMRI